ncbi:MAG: A/G-specific adenine glycosylase [Acidobacteria bacterium]|nr:A/G-specific adenine glycosylase [Acidobacteriota bacterium]
MGGRSAGTEGGRKRPVPAARKAVPRKPTARTTAARKPTARKAAARTAAARKPTARKAAARTAAARKPAARVSGKDAALLRARQRVLIWYGEHARTFPWRGTRDPYRILVAETMLQQTQTGRVVPTYQEFVRRFPTLERLVHAPAMEVIQAWRGLGYNRRAADLHAAAQAIEHEMGGVFPHDPSKLKRLPGVGDYTASAVACFAFDQQVPVVDTNVRRVLARAALGKDAAAVAPAGAVRLATKWLPPGEADRWNQALMDLGAMVCRSEHPLCRACPLRAGCRYHAKGRHRAPARPAAARERFEGSPRQARGGIVDHLRDAAHRGVTLSVLARALHPDRKERDLGWLVELLEGLARDGLVEMTPAARRGSPRGVVRLPA